MATSNNPRMIMFHLPGTPALKQLGIIALRHAQLDHVLRMTIKSLASVSISEALDATAFEGSAVLRDRIRKLAKQRLGEGQALIQPQALMERCKRATESPNRLTHNIWAKELDGATIFQKGNLGWGPPPKVKELKALGDEIRTVTNELNEARLLGFLFEALKTPISRAAKTG